MKLTAGKARVLAVGMIAVTLVWSRYEMRVTPAAGIDLEAMPKQCGQWSCTDEAALDGYGIEAKTITRTYRGPDNAEAAVIFQGTYTRLGALRDWPLARATAGWSIPTESTRDLALDGDDGRATVRLQQLTKDRTSLVAVSWYTSPSQGVGSLAGAEVAAWRDRLVGRRTPWVSLYVAIPVTETVHRPATETAALELAQCLVPELRAVAVGSVRQESNH